MSEEHKMSSTGLMWESRRGRAKQGDQTAARGGWKLFKEFRRWLVRTGNGGPEAFC